MQHLPRWVLWTISNKEWPIRKNGLGSNKFGKRCRLTHEVHIKGKVVSFCWTQLFPDLCAHKNLTHFLLPCNTHWLPGEHFGKFWTRSFSGKVPSLHSLILCHLWRFLLSLGFYKSKGSFLLQSDWGNFPIYNIGLTFSQSWGKEFFKSVFESALRSLRKEIPGGFIIWLH